MVYTLLISKVLFILLKNDFKQSLVYLFVNKFNMYVQKYVLIKQIKKTRFILLRILIAVPG